MKRTFFLACSLLAGLALLTQAGCTQPSAAETPKAEAAGNAAASVDRVTAGQPQRKMLQRYTAQPGRIEAFEETPLYARLDGYAEEVLVDIGDRVEKQQPLLKLWVPELKDELAQKEALLAQAAAEVDQAVAATAAAEAAARTADARVNEAQAGIARAEAEYQRWKAEHGRINALATGGSVTQKVADETLHQFKAADAARQEAAARVESAKAAASQSEANVASAKADEAAAEARQRVAEANLAQAKTMLAYTEIRAPFDGIITRRGVDTGHYVQPPTAGGKPLFVVCHAKVVRMFVDIPEMETGLIDVGDTATIQLQALGGGELPAKITRTSWDLDPANRSLRVEIDLPNPEGRLRPGMYATANILLAERPDALVLPATAIVREGRQTFCCLVVDGQIRRTPIELGLRSGPEVEVLSGLSGNETVVLVRADALVDGQPVEVLPPEQPK